MELLGSDSLTNLELLAIIIKDNKFDCLKIANNILYGNDRCENISDFDYLDNISIEKLKTYRGIGKIKAIQIKAVIEFAKRISKNYDKKRIKIKCPNDVFECVYSLYIGAKQECLRTIILDKQNNVLSIHRVAIGSIDNINIGLREILSEPIKQLANGIILVHNHPSGSLKISTNDINFTKKVEDYSKIFNIQLLDHIIIANNKYVSMKEIGIF